MTEEKALAENVVRNQKYNPYTFIFVVLFNEFKFFFNLYFLLVALSQFIPQLQIGMTPTHYNTFAVADILQAICSRMWPRSFLC